MLRIELDDINSVPRVFLNDEEVKGKIEVNFHWKTKGGASKEGELEFSVSAIERKMVPIIQTMSYKR